MNRKRRFRARKSGTKSKKQKFLSLRLQFPADDPKKTELLKEMSPLPASGDSAASAGDNDSHQLHLFPLPPEHQLEERENNDHENVAYFFSAADGGATSLTGLLSTATVSNSSHATANYSCSGFRPDDLSPSSDSRPELVRNAMKSREWDSSEEEKWVFYSDVVERKVKEEEVTSSAVDLRPVADDQRGNGIQRLSLKLDYQEILNAWSDKGPLYVHTESSHSQIVPDINEDNFLPYDISNHAMGWGCNVGLWTVPEMSNGVMNGGDENYQLNKLMAQREASVLRYKEKRQNRLFSKKIRYQVRKLNAEKRPRLKGRFVKRS